MPPSLLRRIAEYGFAVVVSGVALLLRLWLTAHVGPGLAIYITFYPAVMLAATLYGLGPGLLATVVSALLAAYFILPPDGLAVGSPVDLLGLGIFSGMGLFMSLVAERYRRTSHRAASYAKELAVQAVQARAAVEIEHQRQLLAVTLASIGDAVVATDTGGRITFLNPVAETLTGWRQAEAAGQPVQAMLRILHERTHQPAEDLVTRVLREGRMVTLANHTALLARDGREIPIEYSAAPIRASAGQVAGVVIVFHDVTEKRRAEAALQSVARFPEENPAPILRVSQDATLLYANRASAPLLQTWGCQVGQRLSGPWGAHLTEAYDRGRVDEVEITCQENRIYSCTLTPIGTAGYLNLYGRDITERKRAEAALQQVHAELEQRVQERTAELARAVATLEHQTEQLRILAAELTRTEQRERQRLARILHDEHQQLLAAAKLRVGLLERGEDRQVQAACREITALLQEALAHSRSLAQELSPPILATGNLPGALGWLAGWMAEKHHLQVAVQADPTAVPASDDLTVLCFQAVRELLFNVVKHAQVPTAQVALTRRDAQVQILVSDAGVGFDPTFLRVEGGVLGGFGLFSIRQRVELLGGTLAIDSAPGQGSRFTLTAPLQQPPAVAPPVPGPPVPPARPASTAGAPPTDVRPEKIRVLVVDDHKVVRQDLIRLLMTEPDIEIVGEAVDGAAAVAVARELAPDVILMDVSMPVVNGIEATRRIHTECPTVRVIGLSMFKEPAPAQAMRDAGAVAYLLKSSPTNALLAAIRTCRPGERNA